MKSRLFVLTLTGSILSLGACGTSTSSTSLSSNAQTSATSSLDNSSFIAPFEADSPLIFNEFAVGSSPISRAVELANIGTASLDLSSYSIGIYKGTSQSITYRVSLSGSLAPKSVYVIADSGSDASFVKKANATSDQLINNGTYPMVLLHGEKRVDTLGVPGYQTAWGAACSLVRKNEYQVGRAVFEPYDWVPFTADNLSYLGVLACPMSEARLLQGPKLTQTDLDAPYISNSQGGGGCLPVTVSYYGDGDTTDFNYPAELNAMGYEDGHAFRYQNIDTPEIQHGDYIQAQPWGYAAKTFNNDLLRNATHILIQSVKGGDLTETYGRLLGFVWYTSVANPAPSDYINLNHATVLAGFSKIAFSGVATSQMNSEDLSYYSYLVDANDYAAKLGLKVHGETDPDFNY
jgi:endonuclease YncB( thermonuclease family)